MDEFASRVISAPQIGLLSQVLNKEGAGGTWAGSMSFGSRQPPQIKCDTFNIHTEQIKNDERRGKGGKSQM